MPFNTKCSVYIFFVIALVSLSVRWRGLQRLGPPPTGITNWDGVSALIFVENKKGRQEVFGGLCCAAGVRLMT